MDLQKIKTLLDFVGGSRVSELTVSEAGTTITIRNAVTASGSVPATAAAPVRQAPAAEVEAKAEPAAREPVRSPLSGVVHQSHTPGAAPLVAVGDAVEAGQPLCIVEAMKVFTTVPSPVAGTVRRVFFEDGQEVAFGQPLVEID